MNRRPTGGHKPDDFLGDDATLEALIQKMPQRERQVYLSYGSRSKEVVFPLRHMVVYRLERGRPVEVEGFKVGHPEMPLLGEFQFPIEIQQGVQMVGYVPQRLRNREVFLHVPQRFELKWAGRRTPSGGINFAPQFAVLIKTRNHEDRQIEGDTYCVAMNRFNQRFPDAPYRY